MPRTRGNESVDPTNSSPPETVDGMILVNLDLHPVAIDNGGRIILRALDGAVTGEGELRELPMEFAVALRAIAPESLGASALLIAAGAVDYNCRVFVMDPQNDVLSERLLAIYFKQDRCITEAVRRVGRCYHLTPREQEALVGISMGLTSRQLATRMNISPNTVNAFLRLIMVKMGVTTRAGIVGKLIQYKNGLHENGGAQTPGRA